MFGAVSSAADWPSTVVASGIISGQEQKSRELEMLRRTDTSQQCCPQRLPTRGQLWCPEPGCAPAGGGQCQMCAHRTWPVPAVPLQKPSQTWAVLAASNCCKISDLRRKVCCRGDVSRFLSSSVNVFRRGMAMFWFKTLVGRRLYRHIVPAVPCGAGS